MGKLIKYNKLFAYSEKTNKYFYTQFYDGINLIHGKNTSGKSTLIQSILYTFGINDSKYKLKEILDEEVIFRVDFSIEEQGVLENVTIIRDDDFLVIKRDSMPTRKFSGVNGNNSNEHISLKCYIAELLGFSLYTQSDDGYIPASIESMFLPYYIAQDVGWVSRHKSFSNLEFVKNFKFDFFDYYLGITNDYDREEKQRLEKNKKSLNSELTFLREIEKKDSKLQLVKLNDEQYISKSNEYLATYNMNKEKLIRLEKEHSTFCNKLAFKEQQKHLLSRIKRALNKQNPHIDMCPTCNQSLPSDLIDIYEYHQNKNDTDNQLDKIKLKIVEIQSKINSIQIKINELKKEIATSYAVLSSFVVDQISLSEWLENKANLKLLENISKSIVEKMLSLEDVEKKLLQFKTDEEIKKERNLKDYKFKQIFTEYMEYLCIKEFDEDKYYLLYKMPTFPKQGVELLKTILAFNFAFVNIISKTSYVHRLPFLLDAIFKEDFEEDSKGLILKFINKNQNINHQMLITISDTKNNRTKVKDYSRDFFNNRTHLICINDERERSFLSEYKNEYSDYLEETFSLID